MSRKKKDALEQRVTRSHKKVLVQVLTLSLHVPKALAHAPWRRDGVLTLGLCTQIGTNVLHHPTT